LGLGGLLARINDECVDFAGFEFGFVRFVCGESGVALNNWIVVAVAVDADSIDVL